MFPSGRAGEGPAPQRRLGSDRCDLNRTVMVTKLGFLTCSSRNVSPNQTAWAPSGVTPLLPFLLTSVAVDVEMEYEQLSNL